MSNQERHDNARRLRVHITYDVEIGETVQARELPFVVGVLADLSGQPKEPPRRLKDRKFVQTDRYNFDAVLRSISPHLAFEIENTLAGDCGPLRVDLTFHSMEDFEPEGVARQVPELRELLEKRAKLAGLRARMNDSLEDSLQEILSNPESLEKVKAEIASTEPALGVAVSGFARHADDREAFRQCVREFFIEFFAGRMPLSKDIESMLSACISSTDRALSQQLGKILHAESFQRLEAAWRGLEYLVSRTPASDRIKVRVLNVSKRDLLRDLQRAPEFDQSAFFMKVYTEEYAIVGGEPFAAIIGDYYFGRGPEDIELLERISQVAAAAHAPFVAAATPDLFNLDGFTQLNMPRDLGRIFGTAEYAKWKSFRSSEDSHYVALAVPRMLLRPPYGQATMPVEAFDYEEFAGGRVHSDYLWGNAAYAFAVRLIKAFHFWGWCAAIHGEEAGGLVEGLPTHRFLSDDGDIEIQCPAEIAIGDRRAVELVDCGFIPLLHRKGTDLAVFMDAPSCHRAGHLPAESANASAALASRLEYVMAASRFAHYMKSILRDKSGIFASAADCSEYLNRWVAGYVLPEADQHEEKARYPLAYARIEVADVPGRPGHYRAVAFLKPHFQLHSLQAPLRVVTSLEHAIEVVAGY